MILVIFTSVSVVYADDNATLTACDEIEDVISLSDSDAISSDESEAIITDDNYDQYFNKYTGKLKPEAGNVNSLKIGNVSNKLFTIEKTSKIESLSPDCQIKNGVIHLMPGSDGTVISGLIINNTKGDLKHDGILVSRLHGIWFTNSSNNLIYNNTIYIAQEEGCYAMPMGYSHHNQILNNKIISGFTSCILMGSSDYNNISNNYIEETTFKVMTTSNLIYFCGAGFADFNGPGSCIGTYISNNYFKGVTNNEWSYILALEGKSDNTKIINNTIIKGAYGIYAYDPYRFDQSENILIEGNTIINSSISICSANNNVNITKNNIIGSSMGGGIYMTGDSTFKSNSTISDNHITYDNLYHAIYVSAPNTLIKDNHVTLSSYGVGIELSPDLRSNPVNSIVTKNIINVRGDNGMGINTNNATISKNTISTKSKGIVLSAKSKIYNNTISSNKIFSEDYGVYISGRVFNSIVYNNIIDTNNSEGIYINVENTLEDRNWGNISDNSINGFIENSEAIIVNDSNFYDYFDEDGYLKYTFKPTSKRMMFFTFLSNKDIFFTEEIILTSNKMPNLLFNVTITLKDDAWDSSISDLKFYNINKKAIVLDGVENTIIDNNEFIMLADDIFDFTTISIMGKCENCEISNNDIFINSKANYAYAISASDSRFIVKKFSKGFNISNNNILIKSQGISEAMYFDSLVESEIISNNINIISESNAYGIALCNVGGTPYDFKIKSNEIIINSKEMSYLIEIYMIEDCEISNNYLMGASNGIYGIGIYNSKKISIDKNEIALSGYELTQNDVFDSLGKGNVAIYINKSSQISSLSNNIIDVENCVILSKDSSTISNLKTNNYVISNYNYDLYFNSKGKLNNSILKTNDNILFKNFTLSNIMDIDIPVLIKPYKHLNNFRGYLILSGNSSTLKISGFNFKNATIKLNDVNNVLITDNAFLSDNVILINDGNNNNISKNSFDNDNSIIFENTSFNYFTLNNVVYNSNFSDFITIKSSNNALIVNNSFNASGKQSNIIYSDSSNTTKLLNNTFNVNAYCEMYVYNALKSNFDEIMINTINIKTVSTKSAVYYGNGSANNNIQYNKILSYSDDGKDYAIIFDGEDNLANIIANNYLLSSNNHKRGDFAVNAANELVCNNTPVSIYVSANVNVSGNGSINSPYATLHEAIENSLSGSIIYIFPGYYNESNLIIDKNIILTAFNQEGNVYIDASNNQLFDIRKNGNLTVNALKIFNGFSVDGGSLFKNRGSLTINNSMIYNSSSYYNNSNPSFTFSKYDSSQAFSHDCRNLGLGGAILNYGELLITSSDLFNNLAHKGGAIADFGKTTILNSLIYNNSATHGGAVYTDSKKEFTVDNSYFFDNVALQTLDYCYIQRSTINGIYQYRYLTACGLPIAQGGAIYSNSSLIVSNSLFEHNSAKTGGAIAQYAELERFSAYREPDYSDFGSRSTYIPTAKLTVVNSTFRYNEATNTSYGNLSMMYDIYGFYKNYWINFHGGAIYGTLEQLTILDSLFEHNYALTNGGALCTQSQNATIEGCEFYDNTAGSYGGALDVFGNFQVVNTDVVNNSAKYGGALQYTSYSSYNHIQNNMAIFNVTVAGNTALTNGGAFLLSGVNFSIKNSNIYDNTAPEGTTFATKYDTDNSVIDARSNWWGSVNGPDNSIWSINNIRFRTWKSDRIDWDVIHISPSNNNNDGNGNIDKYVNNGKSSTTKSPTSTGSNVHTGSTLNNGGSTGTGSGGNSFSGNWPYGTNNFNNQNYGYIDDINNKVSSQSKTSIKGSASNPNSLSKSNSSSVNNLASVGMTANAPDSSEGSSTSSQGGGGDSSNAYEIKKEIKKDIDDIEDNPLFILLFFVACILFLIGFYKKYSESEN